MLAEGKQGIQTVGTGQQSNVRLDKQGSLINSAAHGAFNEAAINGKIMISSTAISGVAPGTTLSTTPPMTLWNPVSSGVNLSILKAVVGYVSGTLGAGSVVYASVTGQTTAPSGGTEIIPQCTFLGASRGAGRTFTGSTVSATPAIVRPGWTVGAFLATTALQPTDECNIIDGALIVAPGTCLCIQEVGAAGTTPLVIISVEWEEIPQ
jgi:hypothetical protein